MGGPGSGVAPRASQLNLPLAWLPPAQIRALLKLAGRCAGCRWLSPAVLGNAACLCPAAEDPQPLRQALPTGQETGQTAAANSLSGGQLLSSWASILLYFFLNKQTPPTFSLIHTLPSRETTDVESICVTPTYHHAWQPVAISANNSRTNCFVVNYFLEFSWYAGKLVIVYVFQCQSVLMIYLVPLGKVKLQKLHCISLKFPGLINYN